MKHVLEPTINDGLQKAILYLWDKAHKDGFRGAHRALGAYQTAELREYLEQAGATYWYNSFQEKALNAYVHQAEHENNSESLKKYQRAMARKALTELSQNIQALGFSHILPENWNTREYIESGF